MRLLVCVVLAVAGLWAPVYADVHDLLSRYHKPTIAQVLRELGDDFEKNPFESQYKNHSQLVDLRENGPILISELEYAYPGSIWAPLGRDSSFVADMLEAFYYYHSDHRSRVVRLNASSTSFGEDADFERLLKSAGLLDENGLPAKHFVILDPTSWKPTSQSRRLLKSAYQNIPEDKRREAMRWVNAIALGGSSGNGIGGQHKRISKQIRLNDFWESTPCQEEPSDVLVTLGSLSYLPLQGDREICWHGKFEKLSLDPEGRWVAPPGKGSSAAIRQEVLWQMVEMLQIVRNPEFLKKVKEHSLKDLNYQFDVISHPFPEGLDSHGDFLNWIESNQGSFQVIFHHHKEEIIGRLMEAYSRLSLRETLAELHRIQLLKRQLFSDSGFFEFVYKKILRGEDLSAFIRALLGMEGQSIKGYLGTHLDDFSRVPLSIQDIEMVSTLLLEQDRELLITSQLDIALNGQRDLNRFLKVIAIQNFSPAERQRWIQERLDAIFGLSPSVVQINLLAQQIQSSRHLYLDVMTRALPIISSKQEYEALARPRFQNSSSKYRRAEADFWRRNPDIAPFWYPKRWIYPFLSKEGNKGSVHEIQN